MEKSKIAFVVFGAGIAAGFQHQPIVCTPSIEFCSPEPIALPDEAPEALPRGPAPQPPGSLLQFRAAFTASYNATLGPYPLKV